jgi:hypothetical protein
LRNIVVRSQELCEPVKRAKIFGSNFSEFNKTDALDSVDKPDTQLRVGKSYSLKKFYVPNFELREHKLLASRAELCSEIDDMLVNLISWAGYACVVVDGERLFVARIASSTFCNNIGCYPYNLSHEGVISNIDYYCDAPKVAVAYCLDFVYKNEARLASACITIALDIYEIRDDPLLYVKLCAF